MSGSDQYTLQFLIDRAIELIQTTVPILFGLIVLATMLGGTYLIFSAGSEESARQGKQMLLWGVLFLVVAVGLWSIVQVIRVTFGLT